MHAAALLLACSIVGASADAPAMPDTSRMNILLIDIEDTNAAALGVYGNPICKTPHLQRFAETAVRFDAAYVQAVCCNPSRTSFLTGLRPLTTGVTSNGHVMDEHLPPGTITLPEMLKARGFYLADIGKLFHRLDYADKQMAVFDRIEMYDRPEGWQGPDPILDFPAVRGRGRGDEPAPKDRNSKAYRQWRAKHSDRFGDSGLAREEERDYRNALVAVALLKEFAKEKRHFFLAMGQSRPHTPLVAPKQYVDMYDPATIPMPPAPVEKLVKFPYMKRATGGNPDIFMQKQPTPEQVRGAIAAYYACLTFVDDNIGMVLRALEEAGLADNTIVIFLGDHGFHLGDHNFWSKYSMLEQTRRAPLIVRVPGAPANGKVCREIVEFVDLVPTIGELVELKVPGNVEGTSFVPLLVDPNRPWKKAMFLVEGDSERGQVVRTKKYSYMEFEKGEMPAALYDLQKDPWETANVVDDPAYADVRRKMADLLHAGWKAARPPGVKAP
jgi:uncharacterized sulfatase